MATKTKEPMISQTNRPTAIDYDIPITNFKLRDLVAVVNSQVLEHLKHIPQPEIYKPEKEFIKPEKELRKPEKELLKTEKEVVKSEKELLKPEKERLKPELSKPEKELDPLDTETGRFVESIAARVVEIMKSQGIGK